MTHSEVLTKFKEVMAFGKEDHLSEITEMWWPNGRNSIRIRLITKKELIFTYNDANNWSLMTKDEFIKTVIRRK